jgi:kynurenine formamidase
MFYDLSHPIANGMTFFPGDPPPRLQPAEAAPPWRVTELHIGTHTGTHIDAASHFLPEGRAVDEYPVARFILPGVVVPVAAQDDEPIGPEAFAAPLPSGGALVIRTGWDRHWGAERYFRHPYLSPEAANRIAASGVNLVGIDALNVDSTAQGASHAHAILLGRDILIVENLARLEPLTPGRVYQFSFLPLRLAGLDGSPVRAVAWEEG